MKSKSLVREPKFVYLEKESELQDLIPGDLVTLRFLSGDPFRIFPEESFHAVYEGIIYTRFGYYFDKKRTANEKGLAFLDLERFLEHRGSITSYRLKRDRIGKSILVDAGEIEIDDSALTSEAGLPPRCVREDYYSSDNLRRFREKLRLLKIGEKLFKKLYTFDKVVYLDDFGKEVKEEGNGFFYR